MVKEIAALRLQFSYSVVNVFAKVKMWLKTVKRPFCSKFSYSLICLHTAISTLETPVSFFFVDILMILHKVCRYPGQNATPEQRLCYTQ